MVIANNQLIKGKKLTIIGNGNTIIGNHNVINGSNNEVKGNHNTVNGHKTRITGNHNQINGNENIMIGSFNNSIGNKNSQKNAGLSKSFKPKISDKRKKMKKSKQSNEHYSNTGLVVGNLGPNGVINFIDSDDNDDSGTINFFDTINTIGAIGNVMVENQSLVSNIFTDDNGRKESKYKVKISNCKDVTIDSNNYAFYDDSDEKESKYNIKESYKNNKKKEKENVIPEGKDEKLKEDYAPSTNCIICEENVRSLAIDNCDHFCCCYECADKIMKTSKLCPICKEKIVKFRKVLIV